MEKEMPDVHVGGGERAHSAQKHMLDVMEGQLREACERAVGKRVDEVPA